MRKIVVSTFVTLDGVMEAPETWSFDFHSEDTLKSALDLLLASDALLLGRTTYEGSAAAWPGREDPMGFADKMNSMPKHVVSTTLTDPSWNGTEVISGDVLEGVRALKQGEGGPLLMYGSATLMRGLMAHDLIDEFHFLLNPVVVGHGARLFPEGTPRKALKLAGTTPMNGGMTILRYHPADAPAPA
jgi:dihydrofolate reductase